MLVPYTFDLENLSIEHLDSAHRKVTRKRILPKLIELGVFVYSKELGLEAISASFKEKFPDRFRQHMLMFLAKSKKKPADFDASSVTTSDNLTDLIPLKGHCHLFSTNREKMTFLFEISENEISHFSEEAQVEITPFEFLDQSESFLKSERLAKEDIKEGTRISDIWRDRFASFANSSKEVIIIDRYATSINSHNEDYSGLRRFLMELEGASEKKKNVSIYSAYSSSDSEGLAATSNEVYDRVESIYKELNSCVRGGIREIKVYAASKKKLKKSHDRRIYFDDAVFKIGVGLEVFQDNYEKPVYLRNDRDRPTGKVFRDSTCVMHVRECLDNQRVKDLQRISDPPHTFRMNAN